MARRARSCSPRRSAVLCSLEAAGVDALLVTSRAGVRYLTGFTGTNGWLFLAPSRCAFLTDPRYEQQARAELDGTEEGRGPTVEISEKGLEQAVATTVEGSTVRRVGFESRDVTVALRDKLEAAADVDWLPCEGLVETVRRTKDEDEIDAVSRALAITESALLEVAAGLRPGQTETEVAAQLEYSCRRRGAEGMAFETIVASGPRSALPHGVASGRVVAAGEPLMIDMGCRIDGYCSDITRMVWCGGEPDARWLRLHALVDHARAAALEAVRVGIKASEVDAAARKVITAGGFGEAFAHGTGHGVGLEIHEEPTLSRRGNERLEAGMVVTIEPAIYLPGDLGIRIEDMAQVTADGHRRLTTLSTKPILRKTP